MDNQDILSLIDIDSRSSKSSKKKRKWREIEAIQDQYRLRKELADIDLSIEFELEQMERNR